MIYSSSMFSSLYHGYSSIGFNLLVNKIDISSLNIDCVKFETNSSYLHIDIATIKLNDNFVKVATVSSNCSTVFIFENTFDELLLNILFKTGGFSGAFSTKNLFNKSIKINDEIYFLPFNEKMRTRFYYGNIRDTEEAMLNKANLDIKICPEKFIKIAKFCFITKIFDDSDYMLTIDMGVNNSKSLVDIINQYKLFGVYYKRYYKNFKSLFKNPLNYRAVRTGNKLCVLTT